MWRVILKHKPSFQSILTRPPNLLAVPSAHHRWRKETPNHPTFPSTTRKLTNYFKQDSPTTRSTPSSGIIGCPLISDFFDKPQLVTLDVTNPSPYHPVGIVRGLMKIIGNGTIANGAILPWHNHQSHHRRHRHGSLIPTNLQGKNLPRVGLTASLYTRSAYLPYPKYCTSKV